MKYTALIILSLLVSVFLTACGESHTTASSGDLPAEFSIFPDFHNDNYTNYYGFDVSNAIFRHYTNISEYDLGIYGERLISKGFKKTEYGSGYEYTMIYNGYSYHWYFDPHPQGGYRIVWLQALLETQPHIPDNWLKIFPTFDHTPSDFVSQDKNTLIRVYPEITVFDIQDYAAKLISDGFTEASYPLRYYKIVNGFIYHWSFETDECQRYRVKWSVSEMTIYRR